MKRFLGSRGIFLDLHVGRGDVPRFKIAGETRSDARMASEGPRATESRPGGLSYPVGIVRGGNPLGCACGIRGPPRYGKHAGVLGGNPLGYAAGIRAAPRYGA